MIAFAVIMDVRGFSKGPQGRGALSHHGQGRRSNSTVVIVMVAVQLVITGLMYSYFKNSYAPAPATATLDGGDTSRAQQRGALQQDGKAGSGLGALLGRHQILEARHHDLRSGGSSAAALPCKADAQPPKLDSLGALLTEGKRLEQALASWKSAADALDGGSGTGSSVNSAGLASSDGQSTSSSTLAALLSKLPGIAAVAGSGATAGAHAAQRSALEQAQSETKSLQSSSTATATSSSTAVATATTGAGASADAATCLPNGHPFTTVVPPPPQYMMRPAEEVAKVRPPGVHGSHGSGLARRAAPP